MLTEFDKLKRVRNLPPQAEKVADHVGLPRASE
jgi:hypothetical protein